MEDPLITTRATSKLVAPLVSMSFMKTRISKKPSALQSETKPVKTSSIFDRRGVNDVCEFQKLDESLVGIMTSRRSAWPASWGTGPKDDLKKMPLSSQTRNSSKEGKITVISLSQSRCLFKSYESSANRTLSNSPLSVASGLPRTTRRAAHHGRGPGNFRGRV